MTLSIEIDERQYNDILRYCDANCISVNDYIVGIISEKHLINKYGDLNDIIPKAIEASTVIVKKRGRPKKKPDDAVKEDAVCVEKHVDDDVVVNDKVNGTTENDKDNTQAAKPTIRRKRSLNTL